MRADDGRRYAPKHVFVLKCKTASPIHIGGLSEHADNDVDLSLARDASGRLILPGTSIAGALRGLMGAGRSPEEVKVLWGGIEDGEGASLVSVDDAELPESAAVEVRDGVGIDRRHGVAAAGIKFTREVVPAGVEFDIRLVLQAPPSAAALGDEFEASLSALAGGSIRLGAGKTRGLGRVAIESIEATSVDLADPSSRRAFLLGNPERHQLPAPDHRHLRPTLSLGLAWKPWGPVSVRSGFRGLAIDHLPLTTATGSDELAPVIPGSSIKGALRSHAERIVRSMSDDQSPMPEQFVDQLDASGRLVHTLFGRANRRGKAPLEATGIGSIAIDDCVATSGRLKRERWADVVFAGSELEAPLPAGWQLAFYNAVDRWTGGAADKRLFTGVELFVEWDAIRMELDLERLTVAAGDPKTAWTSLFLFVLTLRDFCSGWIPLGGSVNRGLGSVRSAEVEEVLVRGALPAGLEALADCSSWEQLIDSVDAHSNNWLDWCAAPAGVH